MSAGLAATQLALAREHRLASLGALATAAAHELGTPLGTIAVVARELERALPANSPKPKMCGCCAIRPNAAAPSSRAWPVPKRRCWAPPRACRSARCSTTSPTPYRGEDLEIDRRCSPQASDGHASRRSGARPNCCTAWATSSRTPPISPNRGSRMHGPLGRAVDLRLLVEDDGPGFAPEIFERIGEPYVTSRPGHHALGETELGPGDASPASMKAWAWAFSSPKS